MFFQRQSRSFRKSVPAKSARRPRLVLEWLETRLAPAIFNVNSTADILNPPAGLTTLRSSIQMANATPGDNTINLTVPGTYKITLAGTPGETDNAAGEFAIIPNPSNMAGSKLLIQNTSGGSVTVDANQLNRVFDINPNNTNNPATKLLVTMQGFTITNGVAADPGNPDGSSSSGGGIRDQGNASLTLMNMVVTGNKATADGGGVSMENAPASTPWTLTVTNSIISSNRAGDAGGGLETDGTGKVFVTGGQISGNTCLNQGAGIWLDAIGAGSASLMMNGVLVNDNAAQNGPTGAIGNAGTGAVTISNCTVEFNSSGTTGGGFGDENGLGMLAVSNSIFLGNSALGNGGAIQEGGSTTSITNSLLQGNSSGGAGGALFANGAELTIQSSTIAGNTAGGNGGGIELQTTGTGASASTITDSTITGNSALNNAGGTNGGGIDAPATLFTGTLTLLNDTFNANFATNGGGIFWGGSTGQINLQNTIVAKNSASGAGSDANNPAGTFGDNGGNLIGIAGAGSGNTGFSNGTTQTGTVANPLDPQLGPLQNNGGPTIGAPGTAETLPTEAPLPGSPAIGKGITAGAPATDERGFPSVVNGKINVGAVSASMAPTLTPAANQNTIERANTFVSLGSFSDPNSGPWTVTVVWGDGTANTMFGVTMTGSLGTQPHAYAEEGTYTVTVMVTNNSTSSSTSGMFQVSAADANVVASGGFSFTTTENASLPTQTVATFTDPGGPEALGDYSVSINWGDGSLPTAGGISLAGTTFIISGSHTYTDEGVYTLTVTINHDVSMPQTATDTATVADVNVVATGSFSLTAVEGNLSTTQTVATFTDPAGAEANDGTHYSASINWGDSTPASTGTISVGAGSTTFTVSGSHTYAEEGSYTLTVTVNHEGSTPQSATSTAAVSNPNVVAAGGFSFSASEGAPSALQTATAGTAAVFNLGSFSDPDSGVSFWMVDVNWGDNTSDTTFTTFSQGSIGSLTHTYAQGGNYIVTVKVTDSLNASGSASFQVNVSGSPAGVSVTPPANQTATAGAVGFFNLGSFGDANSGANSWTVDVNWGDNTSHSTFTTFSQGSIGNVAHTYAPAGTYTATVKVTDNLNASGSTSFQVNVSGSPNGVVVTSPGNQAATAGNAALVLLGSFSDSNSGANPWTVDVNWGDNTVHSDFVTTVQGSLGGAIHAFAQGGNYTVTVTVTNNLNAFASAFFQVSVAGSTKGVTVTPPGYQPVATFTDPGGAEAVSDYSANISWGDGSTPTAGLISLRGTTFTVSGSRTFAEEGSYTISVTINHEGTTPQTVTSIATVSNPNVLATGGFSFSASEASASSTQPVATFTDPGGPGEPSDYSASITWGDGSAASTGSISLTGTTFTVSGSHSYGEEGTDAITVTINHETTTPQTVTSTATVSDPAVVGSSVTVSATAGSPFFKQVVATFTDPGGAEPNPADPSGTIAKHYKVVSINWGDNTALDASSASLSYSGSPGSKSNPFTVTGSHTYAAAGTYTISVLVNHEGVVSTLTGSASVSNLGQFITSGNPQTKTSSFWASIVGQELLRRFGLTAGGQTLGQWLASTLPKLYGGVGGAPNLSSFTDSQVAIYYLGLFSKSNTIRLDSEALSAALYVFATTSSLGGSIAASPPYSLPVTAAGLGAFAVNIGFNGAAFGVPNFTVLNVFQILQATDNSAVAGEPWGSNGVLRNEGLSVFQPINGE